MKGFLRVRDKPSVYEVARLAGVSTATVSRVLAGYERVLPRTRDKVLTAVTELGYVPSGAARDLAARRTGVLGLCFPDLDSEDGDAAYWYDEVIRGMERAARRSGYAVLIAASHHRDDSGLVLSIAGRCDGLVVLARTAPLAMIEHVATRIPVVLLATEEGESRPDRAIDYLAVANETGAYQVTAHLADGHGYNGICFIAGPPDSPDSARRLDGFRRATAGLPETPVYHGDFTTAGGRRVAERHHRRRAGAARGGLRQRPDRDRGHDGAAARRAERPRRRGGDRVRRHPAGPSPAAQPHHRGAADGGARRHRGGHAHRPHRRRRPSPRRHCRGGRWNCPSGSNSGAAAAALRRRPE